jgi:hypothetical protein
VTSVPGIADVAIEERLERLLEEEEERAMSLALMEVYDALLEAGASEAKARLAAEAVAAYENRLVSIETKLDRLQTKVEGLDTLITHTRMEMRTWGGLVVGIGLSILWRVWH